MQFGKRGQLAIIIIIAIVIIAAVLIFFFYPRIGPSISTTFSPTKYLESCIDPVFSSTLTTVTKQGGYRDPQGFALYQGEKIKYLCYTSEYYTTCSVQQPMIKNHVEDELAQALREKAQECMQGLKSEYQSRGYSVSSGPVSSDVSIIPGKIQVHFIAPLTVTKNGATQSFKGFDVEKSSQLYDLLFTASSIIDYESFYGDSETTLYLQYYPDLKIEKTKLSDGTKIYTLSNVVTKETFTFASRSLSWPPGYGLE
ncbi:hypothetical protein KW805_04825 [Candidatus Pacearchaeota archaeon]|nr:hypothetical protein [Candidatus Pacearchaeota archaeon]